MPFPALAQQTERIPRIGVLMGFAEGDAFTNVRIEGLRQGLGALGWSEGRNVRIDYRFAPVGANAQALAKELVALQPDVIEQSAGMSCIIRSLLVAGSLGGQGGPTLG